MGLLKYTHLSCPLFQSRKVKYKSMWYLVKSLPGCTFITAMMYFTLGTMYLVSELVIISVGKIRIGLKAIELNYFGS